MKKILHVVILIGFYITGFSQQPDLKSFTPLGGTNGTSISIRGERFTGANSVTFGGVSAKSFTVNSDTLITAIVGTGASGTVAVTTTAGTSVLNGFLYGDPPTITSFSPNSGQKSTVVTIIGTNFTGATAILFGGVAATSFNVVSATNITAVVAATGATGNVAVTTAFGSASLDGFTHNGPKISSVTPNSGGTGTTIKIKGINFIGVTSVTIGGENATPFSVDSSTGITAKIGKPASGLLSVTSSAGTGNFDGFIHTGPRISSFSPQTGTTGTVITISGSNFDSVSNVSFGTVSAASFQQDSGKIFAVVGSGATGSLSVSTPKGTATLIGFTFITPTVITSFSPLTGTNGTTVKIKGTNFTGATSVSFGGIAAKSFTVDSATGITAVVGAGASGAVSVITTQGTATLIGFTYSGPIVTTFTPIGGTNGSIVTIRGSNFTGATAVSFGGTAAKSFVVDSATGISAVVGTGTSGNVSVSTTNGTGSKEGFTYGNPPIINSFTPTSGKSGTVVTITGTNFTGATNVSFGGTSASSFTVGSSTSISAIVGTGSSGTLSVTTIIGTGTATGFIHTGPTITSFTPSSGTNGTSIKIIGTNFTGATAVSFGGVAAKSFTIDSSKGITAIVGTGASGSVAITTANGTISLIGFLHTAPIISGFTPTSATTNSSVKIIGTNFTGVTSVSFGGIAAKSFTIDSSKGITAIVGSGATGSVVVTNPSGSATLAGFTFLRPAPIISFTDSKTFCAGGSLLLTSSDTLKNQWYKNGIALNGDSAKTYTATTSGSYTVRTNIGGVLSAVSLAVVVKVNALPVARFSMKESEQCFKENKFSFANTSSLDTSNATSANFIWNFGDLETSTLLDPSHRYDAAGSYTVKLLVTTTAGCKDSASAFAKVNPSPTISRPRIALYEKDTVLCFIDSVLLTSKDKYDRYLWSTGDTTATVLVRKNTGVYLKIGTKDPVCYSDSSITVFARKNNTPVPTITKSGDVLISSVSNGYRWILNNKFLPNEIFNSLTLQTKGIYNVSTSLDKVCWNISKEFLVVTDPSTSKKTYEVKIYPNPSNGIFIIQVKFQTVTSALVNVTIANQTGIKFWDLKRLIFSDKTIRIPVNLNLPKGIYTLRVEVNGEINTQQIIII